jgi:DNA-binding GntR family transcriptional regulator
VTWNVDLAGRKSSSARTLVHRVLRERIVSLNLPPGASLSENELAAELAVSRTPVRESLILLGEEGLVHVYPQLGSFVARIDIGQVGDAQFIREAVELASLREAIGRATKADVLALRALIAVQEEANEAGDTEAFFRNDEEFHRWLMAVGGRESAWRIVGSAKAHLDRVRRLSLPLPNTISRLIGEHSAVVDHLAAGDADAAEAALRQHLRGVFDDLDTIRERHPAFFETGRPPSRAAAGGLR